MTRPMNGLLAGILATIPMSLYFVARKRKGDFPSSALHAVPAGSVYSQVWADDTADTKSSILRGVFFGFAVWTSSMVGLSGGPGVKRKNFDLLPGYLIWGAALAVAERALRSHHQQREIHTLH